jgi:MerR family mercuric resistance operon transcriptional regulator
LVEPSKTPTIGVLADVTDVNVETIRFYQRKGLMQEPDRPLGGIRRYSSAALARMCFIKSTQRLGFSLHEIADLLQLEDGSQCAEAHEQAEHKLADVRIRLADLQKIEEILQTIVELCRTTNGQAKCPLIAILQEKWR